MSINHLNPDTLHKNPAFTQVITVTNPTKLIFVGGQNSVDAAGNIVGDDIATQTKQSLQNVVAALEAAGATLADVVSMKLYVVPNQSLHAGFSAFQEIQGSGAKPPTISVLIVAGLANPDFLIEIEAIATLGAGERE